MMHPKHNLEETMNTTSFKKKPNATASFIPEEISFLPDEQQAYDTAFAILTRKDTFFAPFPSLIKIQPFAALIDDTTGSSDRDLLRQSSDHRFGNSLISSTHIGQLINHVGGRPEFASRDSIDFDRALGTLAELEKDEPSLVGKTPITKLLTEIVTGDHYHDSLDAVKRLEILGKAVPRRVCQHPFKKNDIVWVCRTCQADETCVLCHACFSQSNHEGHDVAFYHAQAGGCCDCGDPDAWDPSGFCPLHGPNATAGDPTSDNQSLIQPIVRRVRGVVPSCIDWLVTQVAANAEIAYSRANATTIKTSLSASSMAVDDTSDEELATKYLSIFGYLPAAETMELDFESAIDGDSDNDDLPVHNALPHNTIVPEYLAAGAQIFSPSAASLTRRSDDATVKLSDVEADERALRLGLAGSEGLGLYIVLHADDIHSTKDLLDALRDFSGKPIYRSEVVLHKLIKLLRTYGQLVIWGTAELMSEVGPTQIQLWMDGDKTASTRMGAFVIERASRLSRCGLFCSILTLNELVLEQRAVAVLQWVAYLARSCDPLCLAVAETILPNRHLVPLLRADFKMSARITKAWYSLLLTLLAVPAFKSHLAAAYCDTYRIVTAKYARGMGVLERSGYTLSVQFLNRVTYVIDLVQKRDLLGKLGKSLLETFLVACDKSKLNGRLDPEHFVLTHRRYSPCVSDLKCVLNVKGMPRIIARKGGSFLSDWLATLTVAQFMDSQIWRNWNQDHVRDESRGWVGAFNASISLGSLFERLLGWDDDEESPCDLGQDLMSCVELTHFILMNGINRWQVHEMQKYISSTRSVEVHEQCPSSLPFSSIAAKHGTTMAMRQLPVSQTSAFSFHLPLHRFLAGAFRDLCLRKNDKEHGMSKLLRLLQVNGLQQNENLFRLLMEFSVLVLSRAAQVRAGLWKRNGPGLSDQVLNYAEPPFCRNMRDADLLLTQFAAIARTSNLSTTYDSSDVGVAFLSNLLLHRLGIFDFVGMAKAPEQNIAAYVKELETNYYEGEKKDPNDLNDSMTLPWTYSPIRDSSVAMVLLEEYLQFTIVFISELPAVVPSTREEQTKQARFRLFREVVHRLASGPKTHSELSEVHHVLSHWDNVLLSDEGKLLNPDDATGAALGMVLADIADRKVSREKMEPDKWELKGSAWEFYDPAFFHISLRCHQVAAEDRPKPEVDNLSSFGWKPKPYAPKPSPSHPFFERLKRDVTADITALACVYRVLYIHCHADQEFASSRDTVDLSAFLYREKSETCLARAIHFITLGAYAWADAREHNDNWKVEGGGSPGSIFYNRSISDGSATCSSWILEFLLGDPALMFDNQTYKGAESALILVHRLATVGGVIGSFVAQDAAVRAGAVWLCDFALTNSPEARSILTSSTSSSPAVDKQKEFETERRKRMAKDAAMARMKAQAAKFASLMDVDVGESEEEANNTEERSQMQPMRKPSFSTQSSSSGVVTREGDEPLGSPPSEVVVGDGYDEMNQLRPRLLATRPRCIICNFEQGSDDRLVERSDMDDGEGQRKKSKRRSENALGFVGYAQPSTVLKGGGGPPPDPSSLLSPVREFVGTHVMLCGHAVHNECCESYLATVSHREDRASGKRDEFRCPLCQRLSNCLVPFIDVGIDWIDSPSPHNVTDDKESMQLDVAKRRSTMLSLQEFLESTPWWVSRQDNSVIWDGQSAYVEKMSLPSTVSNDISAHRFPRKVRSLKKKDLYAAWNAMMRTPRFTLTRRGIRRSSSALSSPFKELSHSTITTSSGEDSTGETQVWKRFMNQIADISYIADMKRLGDDHLHDFFGEFRHYIVEKCAYNTINSKNAEPVDWPSCLFREQIQDAKKQEMSREKLLSKLLQSIQSFTYSCCSEAFEVRRCYRRTLAAKNQVDKAGCDSMFSRFGVGDIECDGRIVVMPIPSKREDDGSSPFDGRIGKLRYFALTIMAASGAVAADLIQIVLSFPLSQTDVDSSGMDVDGPDRTPIAYPILLGHVLTHTVAAMCAACGRARAKNDSLEVVWPVPFSAQGSFVSTDGSDHNIDSVAKDCEGFIRLGLLARILQTLLGRLHLMIDKREEMLQFLTDLYVAYDHFPVLESNWMKVCARLLKIALSQEVRQLVDKAQSYPHKRMSVSDFHDACSLASAAATSFLAEAIIIYQILVPGVASKFIVDSGDLATDTDGDECGVHRAYEKVSGFLGLEPLEEMLESTLAQQVLGEWYLTACRHVKSAYVGPDIDNNLQHRLHRTQGFRVYDWPSAGELDPSIEVNSIAQAGQKDRGMAFDSDHLLQDDETLASMQVENMVDLPAQSLTSDFLRVRAFLSKNCVPLIGGYTVETSIANSTSRPRVMSIPTSYTDLYAELCTLMPDCEHSAVCLICGEVLNAGGRGECTKHSYKCGAGAGMFFLLQECSGLIMHKSKSAYIHSPYVDSHGETPQYRGRPLNLDLERYEHLREVWFTHGVRQKVVAERGSSRQVIHSDFY